MKTNQVSSLPVSTARYDSAAKVRISQFSSVILQNDGLRTDLYALGHGSMLSDSNTSFLVVRGKSAILIDCGFRTPEALERFGVNPAVIPHVFVTHAHGDHVGGLSSLLVRNRYHKSAAGAGKVSLWATRPWAASLWNHSLAGDLSSHDAARVLVDDGEGDLKKTPSGLWYDLVLPHEEAKFADRDVFKFKCDDLTIEAFRTMHTPASASSWSDSAWSTGVLVDESIWISGDTRYDPDLVRAYGPRASVMIHDASPYPNDAVHAPVCKLASMRADFKSKMFLTHLPKGFDTPEVNSEVRAKGFRGLLLAGTKISVRS